MFRQSSHSQSGLLLALLALGLAAPSAVPAAGAPGGARLGSTSVDKPLVVKGQVRAWNRIVAGKGEKEAINFVRTRKNYREEIKRTQF